MREVANSIGVQAIVGAIARTGDGDFDLARTLQALAEVASSYSGAQGVTIEQVRDGKSSNLLSIGQTSGTPRRLPIIAEGKELGFIALYGASMFGPATADRTQVVADLAAIAMMRGARQSERIAPAIDDARYRLINGVGHNLRNTLGAASGYMQLVEMEGDLAPAQHEFVNRSRTAINSAVSLIGDLLEVTRADAGKLTFDRMPVNVNALAREAVRKHQAAAAGKKVEMVVNAAPTNPVLLTDLSYVQQLVDVLVYNSVRYTPPLGRVTVTVDVRAGRRSSDPDNWVCVAVSDTGAGVADAEKVFEEVHRVETAKGNVRFKLAICRRVARLLGGDLMLETEKNVGSTFTLWLPAPAVP